MAYLTPFLSKISGKFTVNVPKLVKSVKLRGWVVGFTGLCQLSQIYPFSPLLFEILNGAGVSSTFTFKVFVEGEREKIAPNRSQKLLWKWSHLVWLYCILSKYRFLSFFKCFPILPTQSPCLPPPLKSHLKEERADGKFFVKTWETMGIFCQHMGNNGKALCANWWEKISRYFIASWLQLQFAKMPGGAFCSWPWGAPVELGSNNPWEKFPSLTNDAEDRKFVWQMSAVGENDFCWGKDFGISPNWLKYDLVYEQPICFVGLLCQKVHTGEVEN